MNDPTNWDVDPSIKSIEVENPEMAREMAKRWNAYPGLIGALKACRNETDDTHTHAMIDSILGALGEINEDGTLK
jgi:hypothetical protein